MKTIFIIAAMIAAAQGFASERLTTQCFGTSTASGPQHRVDLYQDLDNGELRSEAIRVNGTTESHFADNMPCAIRTDGALQCDQGIANGDYTFVYVLGADQALLHYEDNRTWEYDYEVILDCVAL
jgi:hypothetical protein